MSDTGRGDNRNIPRKGQRGFRPRDDYYDRTGVAPPRHLQCEVPGCYDLAWQNPMIRVSYPIKLCEYHTRQCHRIGAPQTCDIPWTEFYRIRDAVRKQLNKVRDTPVVIRAVHAAMKLPGKCHAKATEIEDAGKQVPVHLAYGISLRHRVEPRRFIDHHIAFHILMERNLWTPQTGFPRHTDKSWLRCVHRSLTRGQKEERAEMGPYQASLLRKMIATDLQIVSGRTDYALREAEMKDKEVLPKRDALGWFQDRLT